MFIFFDPIYPQGERRYGLQGKRRAAPGYVYNSLEQGGYSASLRLARHHAERTLEALQLRFLG